MLEHRINGRTAQHRFATGLLVLTAALSSIARERTVSSVPVPPLAAVDNVEQAPEQSLVPADSVLHYPDIPDPVRTPGDALAVTAADICISGYSKRVRNVPAQVKRDAYARYGVRSHQPGEYEIDHLISLELGGSNSIRNLWPESFRSHPWNAYVKDALENELHRRVCAGMIDLAKAQQVITHNWAIGYRIYVHPTPPSASARRKKRNRQRRNYVPPRSQFDSPVP